MDKQDIIKLAREAGIYHAFDSEGQWDGLTDQQLIERHPQHPNDIVYGEKRTVEILERFAALVAAAERNRPWTQKHWTEYEHSIAAAAVASEREACAKVCEDEWSTLDEMRHGATLAGYIRARGQA